MKRGIMVVAVLIVGLVIQATGAGSTDPATVLKAETMAAVVGPYVGGANPIREVSGGGLPWQIDEAKVILRADGRVTAKVEGLVLLDGAPVPEALRGTNPITTFRAVVSCQTIVDGAADVTNVMTDPFPASSAGDSKIEDTVELPSPCFAPIVFVTHPDGAWFAVTGV